MTEDDLPHNVINLGEWRFERVKTGWHGQCAAPADCAHRSLTMDENGHTCTCKDCGKQVSAYWALEMCLAEYGREYQKLRNERRMIQKRDHATLRTKAAQRIDAQWRKHGTVPCCPHCDRGIFPSDVLGIVGKAREIAERETNPPKYGGAAKAEVVQLAELASQNTGSAHD
ncbi:hypothetical protein [Brytella acorum]|uniref:Uncharacterized protein n=1 Tax=Brytella acorum TaxID=2959299 RepID=A0AA35V448_9PROT|nr:hypothetical protein [Brytella acorum]CAI9119574.1 hypothetical protein LMG32879_000391 [Brytella acorum]